MSVLNPLNKVRQLGNGSKVAFDFSFECLLVTDLLVYKVVRATDVSTLLTINTDYTVTLNTATPGGTVTYTVAPTNTEDSFIYRQVDATQQQVLPEEDPFPIASIEAALDKLAMGQAQNAEALSRAVKLPITSTGEIVLPTPEDGRILAWDGTNGDIKNTDLLAGPQGPQGATGPAGTNGVDGIFSEIASQAEAEAGVENTKGMTPLRVAEAIAALTPIPPAAGDMKYSDARVKVGYITRNFNSADANVAYTGVGFRPKAIVFIAAHSGTSKTCIGFGDDTRGFMIRNENPNAAGSWGGNTNVIDVYESAGNTAYAVIKTMDVDGFTLTWAKTGTLTSVDTNIGYIAFR